MPFVDKKDATEKSYGNNDVPNLNLVAVQLSEEMDSNWSIGLEQMVMEKLYTQGLTFDFFQCLDRQGMT